MRIVQYANAILFSFAIKSFASESEEGLRMKQMSDDNIKHQSIDNNDYFLRAHRRDDYSNEVIISPENTIIVNGVEYYLGNLMQKSLKSPNFTMLFDEMEPGGHSNSTFWSGNQGDAYLFMSKDEEGKVEFLNILHGSDAISLAAVNTAQNPGKLHVVSDKDDGASTVQNSFVSDYIETPDTQISPLDHEGTDASNTTDTSNQFVIFGSGCSHYKEIDVAIAYDSSFCAWAGGANKAYNKIFQIVGIASNKYRQQGLCLQIRVAAIESNCKPNKDPYKNMRRFISGCGQTGLLQDFSAFWNAKRKAVPRDAAHLFVGKLFSDGPSGCSGLSTLCRGAYGVEAIPFVADISVQAMLFAHELGHNCGAIHYNDPKYIMNYYITNGPKGFSSNSVFSMVKYLNSQSCLRVV